MRSIIETAVVSPDRKRPHLVEGPVAGETQAGLLVGGGDEEEEDLATGRIKGSEAELTHDDQVEVKQAVDEPADRVVSQTTAERLDHVGCGEVADVEADLDSGMAHSNEQVRLPGVGRADQAKVLLGADPFQPGEVVEGRLRHR